MIIIKSKKGTKRYTNLQWNLAWFVVWLLGVMNGMVWFYMFSK